MYQDRVVENADQITDRVQSSIPTAAQQTVLISFESTAAQETVLIAF